MLLNLEDLDVLVVRVVVVEREVVVEVDLEAVVEIEEVMVDVEDMMVVEDVDVVEADPEALHEVDMAEAVVEVEREVVEVMEVNNNQPTRLEFVLHLMYNLNSLEQSVE